MNDVTFDKLSAFWKRNAVLISATFWITTLIGLYHFYFNIKSDEIEKLSHDKYVPGKEIPAKYRKMVYELNDPILNHYINEYNTLRDDYNKNMQSGTVQNAVYNYNISNGKIWKSIATISIPYPDKYLQVMHDAGHHPFMPTMKDFHKLLTRYERDSINMRYNQLYDQIVHRKRQPRTK